MFPRERRAKWKPKVMCSYQTTKELAGSSRKGGADDFASCAYSTGVKSSPKGITGAEGG